MNHKIKIEKLESFRFQTPRLTKEELVDRFIIGSEKAFDALVSYGFKQNMNMHNLVFAIWVCPTRGLSQIGRHSPAHERSKEAFFHEGSFYDNPVCTSFPPESVIDTFFCEDGIYDLIQLAYSEQAYGMMKSAHNNGFDIRWTLKTVASEAPIIIELKEKYKSTMKDYDLVKLFRTHSETNVTELVTIEDIDTYEFNWQFTYSIELYQMSHVDTKVWNW